MIIRDERLSYTVNFEDLETGETFEHDGSIFIKISGSTINLNALNLDDMLAEGFALDDKVVRIPSELILHESGWKK